MSETRPQGPLDIVRDINTTAMRIDAVAQQYLEHNPDEADVFVPQLQELNYSHPWAGQEVGIRGISPTMIPDESVDSEMIPYVLPVDPGTTLTRGLYNGLTLRKLYDPEESRYAHKLMHMVYVESGDMQLDDYGNIHQIHYYDYMCIQGAEMMPILPIEAHSMEDLEDDPVVQLIDHIVFDESTTSLEKIKRLGNYVNKALRKQEFFDAVTLNHQRASYMNSMGLHHTLKLAVKDVIVNCGEDEDSDDFAAVLLSDQAQITPIRFEIASGYQRVPGEKEPLAGGPPELYARTDQSDGRPLLAALKNVLAVEDL